MYPKLKFSEAEILTAIENTTAGEVEQVLHKNTHNFADLLHLLSPVARKDFIPAMRQKSATLRKQYFGKAIQLYAPLYIGNSCVNGCKYCDFNHSLNTERHDLSLDEIKAELAAIKSQGIDSLLLVAGEDPVKMNIDFLCEVAREVRKNFTNCSVEIAPQSLENYRRLYESGVNGVTMYQETYDQKLYAEYHPFGPKRNYDKRVDTLNRAGESGMRSLGIGFLLGLYNWRSEAVSMAAQSIYLQKHYWRSRLQFSFPRITPIDGGFVPPYPVSEAELEQLMLTFRIIFPQSDMTLSTRECPDFRNKMAQICVSNISAGSRVTPGGYTCSSEDVSQFTLNDSRSVEQVFNDMKQLGLEPIFKFWDNAIENA
ncbi:MAG: 2-iminoacetate synthase ThiH [Victivallaceae bacterium]